MAKMDRADIRKMMNKWLKAWEEHDLEGVLEPFSEEIIFDNWSGIRLKGKKRIRAAWKGWFKDNGSFRFFTEDLFIDENEQKVLFRWHYEGPAFDKRLENSVESRRGVDVMHIRNGKIDEKFTYSKTTIGIDGRKVALLIPVKEEKE
jgi:hypothetical protein